ncbi:hypothetical protein OHA21_26550 [Actinoplanes sp. NBC_00393]|uniref:hypothetical protein n=1 Tax=Actinoplanes sp. NBC_00393 TaxID=2975953 RepID=UPI002E243E01
MIASAAQKATSIISPGGIPGPLGPSIPAIPPAAGDRPRAVTSRRPESLQRRPRKRPTWRNALSAATYDAHRQLSTAANDHCNIPANKKH